MARNGTRAASVLAGGISRHAFTSTRRNSFEHEYESAIRRKAELLASDPTVHRFGDRQPERDYFSIYMHREDCGGGFVAHHTSWDLEQRFRVTYGKHDADSLWSYTAPAGAKEVY